MGTAKHELMGPIRPVFCVGLYVTVQAKLVLTNLLNMVKSDEPDDTALQNDTELEIRRKKVSEYIKTIY